MDSNERQPRNGQTSMSQVYPTISQQRSFASNGFQSCEDLTGLSMQVTQYQRMSLSLRASLSALKEMDLPPEAEEVKKNLENNLQHLEAIMEGRDTSKFTTPAPPAHEVTLGSATATTPATANQKKLTLKQVVNKAKKHADESMRDGAMAPALNGLIKILWPRIGKFVEDMLQNSIEPSINASLPSMFQVKFTKVSLGESSPMLGPLWVEHNDNGAIEFHMCLNMQTDLDVELTVARMLVGVNSFTLKGEMVVLMDPPMDKPPFFGGLQVYFPNPPEISLSFVGAAKVVDVPMLRSAVRSAIDGAVAGVCVLPRRIAVDMNEDDEVDLIDLTYPEPIGILRVTLYSAENLIAADRNFWGGTPTSDPYVVASLGIKSWKSPTVMKTLDPVWGEGEGLTFDFPVHDDCQELSVKVFDYDFASADDLIGVATKQDVKTLIGRKGKQQLALLQENGDAGAGSLNISASFLQLAHKKPATPLPPLCPSQAHLSVKVFTVTGLQSGAEYPFKVRIQVVKPAVGSNSIASQSDSYKSNGSKKILKKSKSMTPAGTEGTVLVEELTNASHPKEQKELAEALRGVALHLHEKMDSTKEIAEILDVSEKQVELFFEAQGEDKKALKAHEEAIKEKMNIQHPRFDEVVQMLLPAEACEEASVVEIAVLDKRQKIVGTATIQMQQLQQAEDLEGPFRCQDTENVEVVAKAMLRWLA